MPTPSRQELIADIRRAAIACNPEIVELKEARAKVEMIIDDLNDRRGIDIDFDDEINAEIRDTLSGIIGRPLSLADILLAISDKELFSSKMRSMAVNGGFYDNGRLIAQWNLRLPFEEQSDETITFIHGLIK